MAKCERKKRCIGSHIGTKIQMNCSNDICDQLVILWSPGHMVVIWSSSGQLVIKGSSGLPLSSGYLIWSYSGPLVIQ